MISLIFLVLNFAHADFAPPNNLKIYPSKNVGADAISRRSFDRAIDLVYNHYAPIVEAKGMKLTFNREWDDPTVNSDTYTDDGDWIINSYGGLARYPGMSTIAAYAQVACHELGHHLGGAPHYRDDSTMSVEGQADMFSSRCMRAIGYSDKQTAASSLSLASVLASLGGEAKPWRPGPTLPEVSVTYEDHPDAQCRLDTYDNSRTGRQRPRCWFAR